MNNDDLKKKIEQIVDDYICFSEEERVEKSIRRYTLCNLQVFIGYDFNKELYAIYCTIPECSKGKAFDVFKKEIEKICCSEKDIVSGIMDYIKELKEASLKDFAVLSSIKGLKMNCIKKSFGEFQIIKTPEGKDIITSMGHMPTKFFDEWFEAQSQEKMFLCIKISAQDYNSAIAMAKPKFEEFNAIMKFLLAGSKYRDVYTLQPDPYGIDYIVLEPSSSYKKDTVDRSIHLINAESTSLNNNLSRKVWELQKKKRNQKEERIFNAIIWCGKAMRDQDQKRSFVQLCFALETLLQVEQSGRGSVVTPSVMNTLSENAAFICGNDYEERMKISKQVKNLYSKRSAIAHGREQDISEFDVDEMRLLIVQIITELLWGTEFENLERIEQLIDKINKKKFS
ncbi:HEPN domain-containing protein [Listeria costaricensis]|uniref:HEPN domain-containing protein n=1 Tax=Listeria costaricensis TaxID=2026604 RepID=UPI000C0866A7|nr:HEPN domain-containing protein [Listeria costaricensis]